MRFLLFRFTDARRIGQAIDAALSSSFDPVERMLIDFDAIEAERYEDARRAGYPPADALAIAKGWADE